MDQIPYSVGKMVSAWDVNIRVVAIGAALAIEWNVPYAWYWRGLMFLGIMLVVLTTYQAVRVIVRRNSN